MLNYYTTHICDFVEIDREIDSDGTLIIRYRCTRCGQQVYTEDEDVK